ncbi:hypothetical protein BDQ12DRAFT_729301 [Crucibulum laeve]|uniref:Uncharacterized protein n=1 Tax=Crucibulum laeve TaxID=68775 RepID=A0A5C3LF19_9AGAR|nr:hypothetical protein BDQ12DRAFT_729301 [Crucibulum laeve]
MDELEDSAGHACTREGGRTTRRNHPSHRRLQQTAQLARPNPLNQHHRRTLHLLLPPVPSPSSPSRSLPTGLSIAYRAAPPLPQILQGCRHPQSRRRSRYQGDDETCALSSVFAQITSVFSASGSGEGGEGKEEGLTAVLYPHRRIKITELVKAGGQAKVEEVKEEEPQTVEPPTPPPSPAPEPAESTAANVAA